MKYYYKSTGKNGGAYYIVQDTPASNERFVQITKAEYETAMTPSEEQIREEKERQLHELMLELYGDEEV